MTKAVIFDIDGVLLDSFEANLVFYQNLMNYFGYRSPTRAEFPNLFHLPMWDTIQRLTGLSSEEEIGAIWEMGRTREVEYPVNLVKTPHNATSTIRALSKSYSLGIVTSRMRETVYEVPKLARLKKYFMVTVAYDDTENHKPHPDPLLLAAKKLGAAPKETVYIGDVENDAKAARVAGMKVIIYGGNRPDGAHAYTSAFETLPALIATL